MAPSPESVMKAVPDAVSMRTSFRYEASGATSRSKTYVLSTSSLSRSTTTSFGPSGIAPRSIGLPASSIHSRSRSSMYTLCTQTNAALGSSCSRHALAASPGYGRLVPSANSSATLTSRLADHLG